MSYFDPKEEVIDLKLTPYGEYLLSIGKLKPSYYAFFDNDIIYDDNWAGVSTERQSEIEPRIQEETPRIHTQVSFTDRERDFIEFSTSGESDVKAQFLSDSEAGIIQDETDIALEKIALKLFKPQAEKAKDVYLQPIGKFTSSKQKAPSWNVGFLMAPLTSSSEYFNVSGETYINIPQLGCDLKYKILRNSAEYNILFPESEVSQIGSGDTLDPDSESTIFFEDGSTISVVDDSIILYVEESDIELQSENFEIELFEISEVTNNLGENKEFLRPLVFQQNTQGVNRIKYSVENFFELAVDEEISKELICPLITADTTKHFYKTKMFDCEGISVLSNIQNFYADIDDTEDVCN